MPERIEQACITYVDSLPGLRAKAHKAELLRVRALVNKLLRAKQKNPQDALVELTQWADARTDAIIRKSLSLGVEEANQFNGALDAVAGLNAAIGSVLVGRSTLEVVNRVVEESIAMDLSSTDEKLIASLGLPAYHAQKLRDKVRSVKATKGVGLHLRPVKNAPELRAVSFGKIRIIFSLETGEIVKVGFRKDVYDDVKARN